VFCWVHASEAGYPVFLKEGYKVILECMCSPEELLIDGVGGQRAAD